MLTPGPWEAVEIVFWERSDAPNIVLHFLTAIDLSEHS